MGKNEGKERLLWLDVVRCVAIIGVIMCHVVEDVYVFNLQSVQSMSIWAQLFAFSVFVIGRLGVPFFLFSTGYLMLDRTYDEDAIVKFWKTKWLGLLIATEFWIVVYNIFLPLFRNTEFSVKNMLGEMLFLKNSSMNHMWYMPMILGMYLLLPFVANALCKIKTELMFFPFVIFAILLLGIPSASVLFKTWGIGIGSSVISSGFSGGVYGLYIFAGYIIKKGKLKKIPSVILAMASVICVMAAVGMQIYSYRCAMVYNVFYNNIFLMIGSIGLFELFSRMQPEHLPRVIGTIAKYSFAVYLVHNPINMILQRILSWLGCKEIKTVLVVIGTLAISVILSLGISVIPKVGKKILYMR